MVMSHLKVKVKVKVKLEMTYQVLMVMSHLRVKVEMFLLKLSQTCYRTGGG